MIESIITAFVIFLMPAASAILTAGKTPSRSHTVNMVRIMSSTLDIRLTGIQIFQKQNHCLGEKFPFLARQNWNINTKST